MTHWRQDTVLGTVLLLIAVLWSWLAVTTIPDSATGVGPRAFPLAFGVMLFVLSAILLVRSLTHPDRPAAPEDPGADTPREDEGASDARRWLTLAIVVAEIVAYGYLLEYCGFVIATPILVVCIMLVNMHETRPLRLIVTPAAITLICWLTFEKLLGIYLANGIWINIG